ncbi:hydroquinone glucosyltransferase-like [Lolium perenne]|uniref:hydroquinone glucosyltransferase-like n=1 Tax=Lolium perenne TaxID=4522 RepID=UPI0021EA7240|nr:hydroquinone glucosyltransferase-like [Lolium perenne]
MESLTRAPTPSTAPCHVVLLACPGVGHLIPLAELASRLVEHHGFAATLVTFNGLPGPEASIPLSVSTASLPAVQMDDLPADARPLTVLVELIRRSLPSLRTLLRSITPLAALVPDFLCSAALPLAAELGVPGYVFVPTSLTLIYLMRRLVELHDGAAPGEYRELPMPLEFPGGLSLPLADLPLPYHDISKLVYAHTLKAGQEYRLADGFLSNTFDEMEAATVESFKQGAFPPVFPVGPLVRSNSDDEAGGSCPMLQWLDRQPTRSVVYLSFGSAGALSVEQTAELAAGLEASSYRFLWVVRMPSLDGCSYAYGSGGDEDDPLAWLPDGFLERTQGRGLAVPGWAPQVRVLSHPATAVFVSHCGWNSALESAVYGVPMLAWPLYAEQRMNAVVLERRLGVALRPRPREDGSGVVAREEVAAAVKELMEGEKGRAARRRAGNLQQAGARAWSPEGSSRRALEGVAAKWKAALTVPVRDGTKNQVAAEASLRKL